MQLKSAEEPASFDKDIRKCCMRKEGELTKSAQMALSVGLKPRKMASRSAYDVNCESEVPEPSLA